MLQDQGAQENIEFVSDMVKANKPIHTILCNHLQVGKVRSLWVPHALTRGADDTMRFEES